MDRDSQFRRYPGLEPARLIALALVALLTVSHAKAGMYPVAAGENPVLKANEALLVVAIDTGMPLEAAFMTEEGARSSRVLKHIEVGHTFQLLRVPVGRYGWHSLRIGDWAHSSYWATYRLSDNKDGFFDVRPDVVNYGGELVVRPRDARRSTIYLANRGLSAINWLQAQHPQLASQREFVYSGHYNDPFPAFYQKELNRLGKRDTPLAKLAEPPDPGELTLSPKVLWQKDRFDSVKLDADGSLLAMQVREDGKKQWAVDLIDLESSEAHRVARTDIPFKRCNGRAMTRCCFRCLLPNSVAAVSTRGIPTNWSALPMPPATAPAKGNTKPGAFRTADECSTPWPMTPAMSCSQQLV